MNENRLDVGLLAHELRRPITILKGLTDLLLDNAYGVVPENQQTQLKLMARAVNQLNELVDSLASSTWRPNKQDPIYFRNLVRLSIDQLRSDIVQRQLKIREHYTLTDVPMVGDPLRMRAVILNLLHNAVKYSPEGGAITITVEAKDNELIFEVLDEGPGISAEDQKHIFERGYRTSNSRASDVPGLGLGLFMVFEVIEERGGKVEVESTPGHGTLFRLKLRADPSKC